MSSSQKIELDEEEMQVAREGSWLCEIFQDHKLTIHEKQKIIRALVADHRKLLNGQSN